MTELKGEIRKNKDKREYGHNMLGCVLQVCGAHTV